MDFLTSILDWASVVALLTGAILWWRASQVKLPETPVTGGWNAPVKPLEPTFEKLNKQSRNNAHGALATMVGVILQAISIALK